MTDLFSTWMELPQRMFTMQQAYVTAMNDTAEAGGKMMTALYANQSAAEAGLRALSSWSALAKQTA